jgi:hypothetical protein
LRRSLALLALAGPLVLSAAASAALQPVRRNFGELRIPRLRAGPIAIPPQHAAGRVTVLVALGRPPLAAHFGRSLAAETGTRRLDVRSAESHRYLAGLARLQAQAAAKLKQAIPRATVSRRLRIILDALTVELPVRELPKLYRLAFVSKVYPSTRFTLSLDVEAAGIQYPRQGQYYVAVDSGHSDFTRQSFAGEYLLHAWLNDVNPPLAVTVTTTVAAGRPTIVTRALDLQSGVDPLSLTIAFGRVAVGAAAYDPISGFAVFPLPADAPALNTGTTPLIFVAGDFQEDKNVDQAGQISSILPNTTFIAAKLKVVNGPALTWLSPELGQCVSGRTRLLVVASATKKIRHVRFLADGRPISTVTRDTVGLYGTTWSPRGLARGKHRLQAIITDAGGTTAVANRVFKICKK